VVCLLTKIVCPNVLAQSSELVNVSSIVLQLFFRLAPPVGKKGISPTHFYFRGIYTYQRIISQHVAAQSEWLLQINVLDRAVCAATISASFHNILRNIGWYTKVYRQVSIWSPTPFPPPLWHFVALFPNIAVGREHDTHFNYHFSLSHYFPRSIIFLHVSPCHYY